MSKFTPFDTKKSMPEVENEVELFWQENDVFQKSVDQRQGNEPFVFYEGPPTANGRPGIHHVLSRTFKDTICRFQTMKGRYVSRKAGWDTHGLPVELQVEKALGLKNKQDIEAYGIEKFNEHCKQSVWEYKQDWESLTKRMGYWADLENPYITYDPNYIESVWWGLKQVWNKGLIYQDYKVVPYCSRCGTALSLAEVAQGYKDVVETSVFIKFALVDEPNAYILAWTTTPWTLPGNVALAVGPDITYVKVKQKDEVYYLAKDRLKLLNGEYELLQELPASELIGKEYRPLFDFLDLGKVANKKAYYVLPADFVTTEDGSGVVHTAVMYGEDDFNLGKTADLPAIHTVDERGQFNSLATDAKPEWGGRFVKEVDKDIIAYLKEQGKLYKTEQTKHTYPFCWRCDTALLYYARASWFVKITDDLRNRLVELNQGIHWTPEHVKNGRFGSWLSGLRDWAISRERYWGTPLPIWVCDADKNHKTMVGSYDELRQLASDESKAKLPITGFDPHKPFIDEVTLTCPDCQSPMHRVTEVIDVWIDSGSMPFAQQHYPFENKERFEQQFPANYIAEGLDQTRGWFNSMLILSTIIFDKPAYKAVISNNMVLDENGKKMSKSKGNVINPWDAMNNASADAVRFYFLSVNRPGDNKNFSDKAVMEYYRKTVMIWWNVVSFFLTYASVDGWQPGQTGEKTELDAWIVSLANATAKKIDTSLNNFDTFSAARTLGAFIDDLSTWYLRRSRKRRDAGFYATLHEVLIQTAKMAAPMMPFTAEATYQALKTENDALSVHLTDFPSESAVDEAVLQAMEQVRAIVTLGHAARVQGKLKLRQPLAVAQVVTNKALSESSTEIVKEELNVKSVEFVESVSGEWPQATDGQLTIAVDPHLTPELKKEGALRDLIREFQEARKKAGCKPGELVDFSYATEDSAVATLIEELKPQLLEEVSGRQLTAQPQPQTEGTAYATTIQLEEGQLWIGLVHVQ